MNFTSKSIPNGIACTWSRRRRRYFTGPRTPHAREYTFEYTFHGQIFAIIW